MKKVLLTTLLLLISHTPARAIDCNAVVLTITSPTTYQTFERLPNKANLPITGTITVPGGTFTASYHSRATLLTNITYQGNAFSGTLPNQPQGQDTLTITWSKDTCVKSVNVPYVGIGDIFLVAGQSNNTNVGINHHTYTHPTLKATLFGNDYKWQELKDPFDTATGQLDAVSLDTTKGGSYIALLATKIMALTKVPVAFIPAAKGGSNIQSWARNTANHLDRNTLYGSATYRAKIPKNIRAILWWQGESDVVANTATTTYTQKLIELTNNFSQDMGYTPPLVAYQIGQVIPSGIDNRMRIVQAIRNAAAANNHIILGPDLGDIDISQPDSTYGVHFVTDAQQQAVADRVFSVLKKTIYVSDPISDPTLPYSKPGDLNGDNVINLLDYTLVVAKFKTTYTPLDYNTLLANYGK